jgi:tRNA (guanine-N7-)-methyltransferase
MRRFVQDRTVAEFGRLLKPDGEFRFASDIDSYVSWTLVRLLRSPSFKWKAERADDWRKPWPDFHGTRYEAKAKREGRTPCYLTFRRV